MKNVFLGSKSDQKGQSLVEVIMALTVAILVILALVKVTVITMQNAIFSRNQSLATSYTREAMERVRAYRDQNTWDDFINDCENKSKLGFDNFPPVTSSFILNGPDCYLPGLPGQDCDVNINSCEVKIEITWSDNKGDHGSELTTILTNWR